MGTNPWSWVFLVVFYQCVRETGGSTPHRGDLGGYVPDELTHPSDIEVHNCPTNIIVTMEPCERSDVIEISWDEPMATSDSSNVSLVFQNVQSGSVFRSGEVTPVEYVFEDSDGDRAYCRFNVTIIRAPSKCFVTHGPHIVSFDGYSYGFLISSCMYTLVSSCGDTDLPQFRVMGDFLSAGSRQSGRFSLREVRLHYRGNEFILREGRRILLNGVKANYPLVNHDGVSVYWRHPNSVLMTDFGLSIKFDGERNAVIFLASSQTVCGLCGTNDFDPLNDRHLPSGEQTEVLTAFVDAWASITCGASSALTPDCDEDSQAKEAAVQQCGALYMEENGPFGDCYLHVDEVPLYSSCVDNVCAFPLDTSLPCAYNDHFAQICAEAEVLAQDWRDQIPPECGQECPVGMTLSPCTSACPRTCAQPEGPDECDMPCVEACVCPEGLLLEGDECILPERCGCFMEDLGIYLEHDQDWTSFDCTQRCYCEGTGELQCRNYTCNEKADCVIDRTNRRTCQCHEGLHGNGELCVADSGFCQAWGDPHYKTFDGRKFSYQGVCQYTLVKPCRPSDSIPDFHLIGDNKRRRPGDRYTYQRVVILRYRGHEYLIKKMFVSVDGVKVTLPLMNHAGVTIHYDVPFTTLQTDFGMEVRYNQRSETLIFLDKQYASLVCGLCGNFDGNTKNELRKPNGQRAKNAKGFAKAFLVGGDPDCGDEEDEDDDGFPEDPCLSSDSYLVGQASDLCQILSPQEGRFGSCHEVADSTMYHEACMYDLCATLPEMSVLCDSVDEFLVACREAGGDPGNWRARVPECPFECPSGFVYSHCGSACLNTCIEKNRTASCEESCQETCQCPEGQYLDGERCVDESECGCLLPSGRYISRGETWTSDNCTELCTCEGGHLQCDYVYCHENARCVIEDNERRCICNEGYVNHGRNCISESGICSAWGHHHFLTYDGVGFDWRGLCSYTFIRTCGDLAQGLEEFHLTGDFDPITVTRRLTGLKRIRLHYDGHEYRIESDRVLLDGLEVTLPLKHNGVHIYLRPIFTIMETDFGLRVVHNQNAYFRMHLSSNYGGAVCGLCGNYDGNEDNDFTMPNGQLAADVYDFGNSWAVEECRLVTPLPDPCDTTPQLQLEASGRCAIALSGDDLTVCRDIAEFTSFYEACTSDLCFSNLNVGSLCASIEAYVALCQERAVIPSTWRDDVVQCTFSCPDDMLYTPCGTGCPATCLDPSGPSDCNDTCVETCTCPFGQVLDGPRCVTSDECGCQMPSGFYLANGQSSMNESCTYGCSCDDRVLSCYDYSCTEHAECDLRDGVQGCWCGEGYFGDGSHCRPATGVCRVWGDPHYITFDGKAFDFQGSCEYLLAGTIDSSLEAGLPEFGLYAVKATKDSELGGSFLRQIRLVYGGNEFVVGPGRSVELNGMSITLPLYDYNGVTIYFSYPSVILETNFGLSLTFDQKKQMSKVDITLPAEYGGRVGGLCGDFDENRHNDFKLPDGTLTRSVTKFGNSWAANTEICEPEIFVDPLIPCREDPSLMAQVEAHCGPLATRRGDIGADCGVVGKEVFYEACLYDLCATQLDSTYMCASVEEFAAMCEYGDSGPADLAYDMYCGDECPSDMVYTDCGDPCPETCADQGVHRNCSMGSCVSTCVCPEGEVLDGSRCVPKDECGCILPNGIYVPVNARYISPDCDQYCTCMDGELSCFDYSCDPDATCTTVDGFRDCYCNEGYIGTGVTCMRGPGEGKATKNDTIIITNCPSDINRTVPLCEHGVMVSWETPTAWGSDGWTEVLPSNITEHPGTTYPPGVYEGYYEFHEVGGGVAVCSFTITVDAALIVTPGQCGSPERDIIEDGGVYTSSDCSQHCVCSEGILQCREITCSQFAECSVQGGQRGCYCLDGYQGDGFTCARTDCPPTFYAFGSSCYYFQLYGQRLNFDDARARCQGMGADLPVIESRAENDYIAEMNGQHYRSWILAKRHPDKHYILERTGPTLEYTFLADPLPDGDNFIEFTVKAGGNAHVLLSATMGASEKVYELVIGGDRNTRTYLSLCAGCPRVANQRTVDILSTEEERRFFISLSGRALYLGFANNRGTNTAFFAYVDRDMPIDVKYVGFGTDGLKGEWAFYKTYSWLDGSDWTYENWSVAKPTTDPEDRYCIRLGYGCLDHWVDSNCSDQLRVICEM